MSANEVTNVVVGVAVVGLLLANQMRIRRVREQSAARFVVTLGVIGIIELVDATKGRTVRFETVTWIVASLLLGIALGVIRALTVKIWRGADGVALRQGSIATAALWVLSLAAHFAMEVGIDRSSNIVGLGAASLLLYVALTLGAQREVVRLRAAKFIPAARPARQ